MLIEVHLFAAFRDTVGSSVWRADLPDPADGISLLDRFYAQYPQLGAYREVTRLAVNHCFRPPSTRIQPDDEIALIPPVSGG